MIHLTTIDHYIYSNTLIFIASFSSILNNIRVQNANISWNFEYTCKQLKNINLFVKVIGCPLAIPLRNLCEISVFQTIWTLNIPNNHLRMPNAGFSSIWIPKKAFDLHCWNFLTRTHLNSWLAIQTSNIYRDIEPQNWILQITMHIWNELKVNHYILIFNKVKLQCSHRTFQFSRAHNGHVTIS